MLLSLRVAILALVPALLSAWGPIGHMTVGYLAYSQLTPPIKARVSALLKLNPDYPTWDKQIPTGTSQEEHDHIIFAIATTWPDDIKGEPQYSDDGSNGGNTPGGPDSGRNIGYTDLLRHQYWHFVDTPFSQDGTALPSIPAPNAQTQIEAFRAVLKSDQPDALKSYDLTWLLHLIGDVHQPLHSSTRVSSFDPTGDAGGNFVKLFGDASSVLHAYWDNLPGIDCSYCSTKPNCVERARLYSLRLRPPNRNAATDLITADWVKESFDEAQKVVYLSPIGANDGPVTIIPESPYEIRAARLAKMRIALAAARLASVLNQELK